MKVTINLKINLCMQPVINDSEDGIHVSNCNIDLSIHTIGCLFNTIGSYCTILYILLSPTVSAIALLCNVLPAYFSYISV